MALRRLPRLVALVPAALGGGFVAASSSSSSSSSSAPAAVDAAAATTGRSIAREGRSGDDAADAELFRQLRALGADKRWPKGEDVERPGDDELGSIWSADVEAVASMDAESKFILRKSHVVTCEWLSRHHPDHVDLRDRLMERAADRLRLWPTKWQWCETWNEVVALSAAPLHPEASIKERWPAVAAAIEELQAAIIPTFVREHDELRAAQARAAAEGRKPPKRGHKTHPEGIHVTGDWTVLNLWEDDRRCLTANFAGSCKALDAFDMTVRAAGTGRLQMARFASLHPGTKVIAHTAPTNERLKVHCGLENPDGVQLRIADLNLTWQPGRCMLIDDSFQHEIESSAQQRVRTILELKLEHPDLMTAGYTVDEDTGRHRPTRRPQRTPTEL